MTVLFFGKITANKIIHYRCVVTIKIAQDKVSLKCHKKP
ncbi:hypothetical protein MGSAQ_000099 [marine sediment metagenome]|uniref:Uncharacterized protein n=1 Tax=marine sediment metagenome TaxID=412755 RepID=A0A1B6NYD3_9ZZZZ